jgi:hypothetical protein
MVALKWCWNVAGMALWGSEWRLSVRGGPSKFASTLNRVAEQLPILGDVSDRCDQSGFQWEFRCRQCGSAHRSPHEHNLVGEGRGLLRMASSLLGGKVSQASWSVDAYNSGRGDNSNRKQRHYEKAVKAVLPNFRQCAQCSRWICAAGCWNEPAQRCTQCKPTEVVISPGTRIVERCNSCGAVGAGKFCSACGGERSAPKACPGCHAQLADPAAAFCSECGSKVS